MGEGNILVRPIELNAGLDGLDAVRILVWEYIPHPGGLAKLRNNIPMFELTAISMNVTGQYVIQRHPKMTGYNRSHWRSTTDI